MSLRVIQWATGSVGVAAIKGVLQHPELELVGCWVHSAAKSGKDVGEIIGSPPLGVIATNSIDDVLALDADAVIYAPLLPSVDEVAALLRSGKNVVTPLGWFYPSEKEAAPLEVAAQAGNATLHGAGIGPGAVTELFPLLLSVMSTGVTFVRSEEFSDLRSYGAPDVLRYVMGFGGTPDSALTGPMQKILDGGFLQSVRLCVDRLGFAADPQIRTSQDAVTATFWLLNASDSLAEQSRRNPDGTGLGVFDEHHQPRLHKQPIAAWQDADFATEAHELTGTTFVAHVRYATTGSLDIRNTHPFLQDGRIFAHNGVVEGLDVLDERLREVGADDLVLGQTDSERVFALITASIRARDGNESAGLIDALRWLAANVPIYAVNVLLSTATDVWALRYPESHELYILDRRGDGAPEFHLRSKRIRAHSTHLRERSSVVFATEPMDDNPRWRLLDAGELVHVDAALRVNRSLVLPDPPRHPIRREDLSEPVLHAQHTSA